ncbi:MAG: peptidylprolyl isomerase, partial [Paracoccaceae bacterium]|nr:peptidylprolyl isomerase [Paracoccaceae bacterium]
LQTITEADRSAPDYLTTSSGLKDQLAQALAQDMFDLYTQAIESEAGITLDQAAINAVHAQMN